MKGECKKLPKPQMHGLFVASAKKNIIGALTVAAIAATMWRVLVLHRTVRRYREFYEWVLTN